MRRQVSLVLTVFLILTPTVFYVATASEGQRLIILVSEDSIIASADRLHVSPRNIEGEMNRYLTARAEQILNYIRRVGISFKLVEILTYSVHAVVIDVPEGQVQYVKDTVSPQKVQEDQILQAALDERPSPALTQNLLVPAVDATGAGILVAVIDTGVDYTHPDFGGAYGPRNKIVGGYDFVDGDDDPKDLDGHGTHVAGIIAANGQFKGIAPEAKILAYRVVGERGNVRTSDVVRAIDRAIRDGARVINLSLGSSSGIDVLRRVITSATRSGVIIVAAAGNQGPAEGTIGSPAGQYSTIAVGSSFIPLDSELRVEGQKDPLVSRAMLGSKIAKNPIGAELVFVRYARQADVEGMDLTGKIAVAERGSDTPNERVFFSVKESAVSSKGAIGMIIFNNQPGMFDGSLLHQDNPPGYYPQISVVSVSRETGLSLLEQMRKGAVQVSIKIEQKPEQVAESSSRGPVSAFYAKPDLIAPGIGVISTAPSGRYSALSGTSFAAPHVTGAVALLLQKRNFTKEQIIGILAPTAQPLLNSTTGELFSIQGQGSGKIDVSSALTSPVSTAPHQLIVHLAPEQTFFSRVIKIESISNSTTNIAVTTFWTQHQKIQLDLTPSVFSVEPGKNVVLNFTAKLIDVNAPMGTREGRLTLTVSGMNRRASVLTLPISVTINPVSVAVSQKSDGYYVSVSNKEAFQDFRIMIKNPDGDPFLERRVDAGVSVGFGPREKGEYWVEAEISDGNSKMFGRSMINAPVAIQARPEIFASTSGIPMRFVQLLFGSITFVAIGASVYLLANNRKKRLIDV